MTQIYEDLLAIIEHATELGALPAGVSEANAQYLAELVRNSSESDRGGFGG